MDDSQFKRLADIAIDVVQPEGNGFALSGQGSDRGEYRLEVHFDMPLDARTRTVLGELLSHSDLTISRRTPGGLVAALRARRERAHKP